jgi:glycerol uptake operon antiterminator
MQRLEDMVEHQVVAAVRSEQELNEALQSKTDIIFLLYGSIFSIRDIVAQASELGKKVFLHLDFMEGIATDRSGISYIAKQIQPAGIISTRNQLIGFAEKAGLMTVQRVFVIDSTAIRNGIKASHASGAHAIEIMPGLMPKVIQQMCELTHLPIIAGGLISTEEEVRAALAAGALAVSVGSSALWNLNL